MATNRIIRIVIGLALIGYGVYSGNAWFYLGVMPLITAIINWCPLEIKMGTCDPATGCCATPNQAKDDSSCCTPAKEIDPKSINSFSTNGTSSTKKPKIADGVTQILILGTGCAKCVALTKVVEEAVESLDGQFEVEKVEDIEKIMSYNVVSTPGLVINGEVKSTGKLLTLQEVVALIKEVK